MKWTYFPKNHKITDNLKQVVSVFDNNIDNIDSSKYHYDSDTVLSFLATDLESIGYRVERSKKETDKIKMPVLYGENGSISLSFDADAYNDKYRIVIEVEAGRAVTNYQFLKDFFEACCMSEAEYLCIAIRLHYRNSEDYRKVCEFFNAIYASERFMVPLKGILIIGY